MKTDLHVLVNQNGIAVRINDHQASRTSGGWVSFREEVNVVLLQVLLNFPHVRKRVQRLSIFIPARIKSEEVALKHALEQPDERITVFHDEVVAVEAAAELGEAEGFVKGFGGQEVFDGEADGKGAEMHGEVVE